MRTSRFLPTLIVSILLSACSMFDPMQQAADAADRAGAQSASRHEGAKTLNAAFQIVETFYYSKKYPGNPEQIKKAMAIGHAAESRIRKSIRREVNSSLERPAELPHYLLVTIGKSQVTQDFQMAVFDTHADQIVGNNIYDLKTTPRASATVKFDTYTTQYVGNGTIVQ